MKRKTKAQREQEQIAALSQRISDIMAGACGSKITPEEICVDPEILSRLIPAVAGIWGLSLDNYIFRPHALGRWGGELTELVAWLYEAGFRADGYVGYLAGDEGENG